MPVIPPICVLNYHNIVELGQESPNDLHSISSERLNEHIRILNDAGYVQVSLSSAFDILLNNRDSDPGFVVTFDDGYTSILRYMNNIDSEICPTVFILTEYTGKSNISWNTRSSRVLDHLDLNDIKELRDYGFDIQMHGKDHHNLLKFNKKQLRERFQEANNWFYENLGKAPDYLAYPYGYCDEQVKKIASEFYIGALSITHGAWGGKDVQFALNRVSVPYYLKGQELVSILRMPPKQRWSEIEARAPYRKK